MGVPELLNKIMGTNLELSNINISPIRIVEPVPPPPSVATKIGDHLRNFISNIDYDVIKRLIVLTGGLIGMYISVKLAVDLLGVMKGVDPDAEKQSKLLMKKLGIQDLDLNPYEHKILASCLVSSDELRDTEDDIGGLNAIKDKLLEETVGLFNVNLPRSRLIQSVRGILLHGPPGCGKTLLARVLAKHRGVNFICVEPSALLSKWYGETSQLVHATFTLASKLEPSIIFIDEIDGLLRERGSFDHEASQLLKTQFMSRMDGMQSGSGCRCVVIGATNRASSLDDAILRRLPLRLHVPLPDRTDRGAILRVLLRHERLDASVELDDIATITDGCSGSDLRQICGDAAKRTLRDYFTDVSLDVGESTDIQLRPISCEDLLVATNTFYDGRIDMFKKKHRDAVNDNIPYD